MAWQYSDPLNGALLAAQKNNQSEVGISSNFHQPFYSSFDPLFSRYQPQSNFFNRAPASINIFDEIDDFELEVETDNILTSARYKVPNTNLYNPPSYVPSNFYKASNDLSTFDTVGDSYKNAISSQNLNLGGAYKGSPNPYSNVFKPVPFDLRSTPPSSFKSDNSYPPSVNSSDPNNHNNHHQRMIQYQHRFMQDKGDHLSELENLKLKQKQDRLQLLESIQQQQNQGYKPVYQEHHIKKQYSETSIPSTNADPLYSNNPTPPMLNRSPRNKNTNNSLNNQFVDNNQKTKDSNNFYYKLNDDVKVPKKYPGIKDKYTTSDYKKYQNNFGFGQQFLPFEAETKQEKIEKARKRQEYSRIINEQNLKKNSNQQKSNTTNNALNNSDTFVSKQFDVSKRNNNFKDK